MPSLCVVQDAGRAKEAEPASVKIKLKHMRARGTDAEGRILGAGRTHTGDGTYIAADPDLQDPDLIEL